MGKIIYYTSIGYNGYANAARGYIYDLIENKENVYVRPFTDDKITENTEYSNYFENKTHIISCINKLFCLKSVDKIILHYEPIYWEKMLDEISAYCSKSNIIIGRTVWDFEEVPKNWVEAINNSKINILSVPSTWCKKIFKDNGVTKEIIVEPHILPKIPYTKTSSFLKNSILYSPVKINNIETLLNSSYKYLTVSSNCFRKNLYNLVLGYVATFQFINNTLLILKLLGDENSKEIVNNFIKSIITEQQKLDNNKLFPPILVISDNISYDEIQNIYDISDVYISLSMGEGFNLGAYEMYTRNKFIIAPFHTGMMDYLTGYKKAYTINYFNDINVYVNKKNPSIKGKAPVIKHYLGKLLESYSDLINVHADISADIEGSFFNYYKTAYNTKVYSALFTNSITYQKNKNFINDDILYFNKNQSNAKLNVFYIKLNVINPVTISIAHTTDLVNLLDVNKIEINTPGTYILRIYEKNSAILIIKFNSNKKKTPLLSILDLYAVCDDVFYELKIKLDTEKENSADNFDVIYTGAYGENIINISDNKFIKSDTTYERKLNMGNQLSFYCHRSGWDYVIKNMSIFSINDKNKTYFDGFLENTFAWRKFESIRRHKIPYPTKWCGFMHNPPNTLPWFSDNNAFCNSILCDSFFKESLQNCKGIFTLSKYHADFIKNYIPEIPVEWFYHPTEIPELKFNYEAFLANKEKKVITIGWWLRKLNYIYLLRANGYVKMRLLPNNRSRESIFRLEKIENELYNLHITNQDRSTVKLVEFVSNDDYDKLLSENIVYLELYDSSANNLIIECMARGTPILINKLPAIVEYLGENYPLYVNSIEEADAKLQDFDLLNKAHNYLLNEQYKIKIENFIEKFYNSKIYKNL